MRCFAVVKAGLTIELTELLDQSLMLFGREFTVDFPLLQGALLASEGVAFERLIQASSLVALFAYDVVGEECQ